ncbi:MAG: hypothetical protein A2542_01905 [Parcubacteria group bacterium RIFOXYD2_FULL_52_8]|nr:MAG: hypothetical protein A2542_01905 [Parcubacteria group bacterium RIFOXYD2_FULL_52_8]
MEQQRKKTRILTLLSIGLLGLVAISVPQEPVAVTQAGAAPVQATRVLTLRTFVPPSLRARAAYVLDPTTGEVLFSRESDRPLPLASLTKVMTAIVAHESGKQQIRYSESEQEHAWATPQLLSRMLVSSSNSAALAVASEVGKSFSEMTFIEAMNKKAVALGLTKMQYRNPTGLDLPSGGSGAEGTAEEVAQLLWYATKSAPELFSETSAAELVTRALDGSRSRVLNTNEIVASLPSVRASKTGLTDLAGGNLAVVVDIAIDHPLVIVVLGSSESGRFTDTEKLVRAAKRYFVSDLAEADPL